mmetsp:Transcript_8525/g.17776  ORF Transcript_8525/g.17776 Transcript_8525/m.17776 type:complete len:204 (+) Transcript_8525:357-968(+)
MREGCDGTKDCRGDNHEVSSGRVFGVFGGVVGSRGAGSGHGRSHGNGTPEDLVQDPVHDIGQGGDSDVDVRDLVQDIGQGGDSDVGGFVRITIEGAIHDQIGDVLRDGSEDVVGDDALEKGVGLFLARRAPGCDGAETGLDVIACPDLRFVRNRFELFLGREESKAQLFDGAGENDLVELFHARWWDEVQQAVGNHRSSDLSS